jgi:hypothetical protein
MMQGLSGTFMTFQLMTLSCRIGIVGILAAIQDGGAQRGSKDAFWWRYKKHRLQPLHFTELTGAFFYSASLVNRNPKFLIVESPKGIEVARNPLQGFSLNPTFNDWEQVEFAHLLSGIIELPIEYIFLPLSWGCVLAARRKRTHPAASITGRTNWKIQVTYSGSRTFLF